MNDQVPSQPASAPSATTPASMPVTSPTAAPVPPTAPGADAPRGAPKKRRKTVLSVLFQLLGFGASLALLYWCIRLALTEPRTKTQLQELAHKPPLELSLLLALSGATVILSGLVFASVVRPVHKLKWSDVIATNSLCTLLGNLPLKISLITRVFIHHRRDGIPLLTIAGWFAAVSAVIGISLLPPVASALLVGEAGFTWWVIAAGGIVGGTIGVWLICGYLASDAGWAGLQRAVDFFKFPALSKLARSENARNLHAGVRMLASWRATFAAMAFRVLDIAMQGGRFYLAAKLLGITNFTFSHAVLAGCTYFFLQAIAPAGALGFREFITGAILGGITQLSKENSYALPLTITAAETVVNIVLGVLGALWIRIDRVIVEGLAQRKQKAAAAQAEPDAS